MPRPPRPGDASYGDLADLAPLSLGLAIGLQATMTALLAWGSRRRNPIADRLTPYGEIAVAPEYDLWIFAGGLAVTLALGLLVVGWWRRCVRRTHAEERARFLQRTALLHGVLAATSLVGFASLLSSYWFSHPLGSQPSFETQWVRWEAARLLVPAAMAAVCAVWETGGFAVGFTETHRRQLGRIGLAAFPVFVALLVAIPPVRWAEVTGEFMQNERLHHLNFFALGPALSFAHGKAFGSEIYSQYGIGWPLLLSKLSSPSVESYAAFVGIEVISGCIYFSALFLALWLWFRSALWAAIAALLAISWQLFSGIDAGDMVWQTPSSTMMRHPFDVGFFVALGLHLRSGRSAWIFAAGAVSALAIFFETETGLYLLAAFGGYWLLRFVDASGRDPAPRASPHWASLAAFYLAAAIVLAPLLLYASRGSLFTRAFWAGWLEPLLQYGSWGVGAMPVSGMPEVPLVAFCVMTAVYTAAIGHAVLRSFRGAARESDVLLASISAYGLALLLLFVGRSHPYNLPHVSVPFVVVCAMLLIRARERLGRWLPHASVGPVLAGGLLLLLLSSTNLRHYPSALGSHFREPLRAGLPLFSDAPGISGLPFASQRFIEDLGAVASAVRSLASDGREVAIFDLNDTTLYFASRIPPWSRYATLIPMILTQDSLADLKQELILRRPGTVVIRSELGRMPALDFAWRPLHELIESRYELARTIGDFEIWTHPAANARGVRAP